MPVGCWEVADAAAGQLPAVPIAAVCVHLDSASPPSALLLLQPPGMPGPPPVPGMGAPPHPGYNPALIQHLQLQQQQLLQLQQQQAGGMQRGPMPPPPPQQQQQQQMSSAQLMAALGLGQGGMPPQQNMR